MISDGIISINIFSSDWEKSREKVAENIISIKIYSYLALLPRRLEPMVQKPHCTLSNVKDPVERRAYPCSNFTSLLESLGEYRQPHTHRYTRTQRNTEFSLIFESSGAEGKLQDMHVFRPWRETLVALVGETAVVAEGLRMLE